MQLASPVDVHWATSGDVDPDGDRSAAQAPCSARWWARCWWRCCSSISPTPGLPIQMVIGAIFVLCILVFRQGVVGEINRLLGR